MSAAAIVDAAATEAAVVFGSLPPEGRDLDVLVRDPAPIEAALAEAGFARRRSFEWARFDGGSVEAVDLVSDWPHLDEIVAEAVPLDGLEHLSRPAPHHSLLLLAQLLDRSGNYPAKRVARMRAALAEDPDAPAKARALAGRWGVEQQLETVLAGQAVEPRARPRRPRVVAVSGIDGAGKSTQARQLAETLRALGYDVEIAWAPLGSSALLHAIFGPVTKALGRLRSLQPAEARDTGLEPNAGSVLRERSRAAHRVWTTLIASTNGLFHARAAGRSAARGGVVIFDRYVLDSRVRLRFLYGERHRYRVQDAIVRALSPRPVGAYFLELSADESLARKDDRWSHGDLTRLVSLYAELDEPGVTRLDATRPPHELAALIARDVWQRLE